MHENAGMQTDISKNKKPATVTAEHTPMMAQYEWVTLFSDFFIGQS